MNIPLTIVGFLTMLMGVMCKPSVPMSAPANNGSIVFMIGFALLILGILEHF